jgi:8-hydroxy-5-deazaflavin:NADPH oxidoreductase
MVVEEILRAFGEWEGAMPVNIGVICTGRVGRGLAAVWLRAGHNVMLSGSRDRADLDARAARLGARSASISEAVAEASVVVIAMPARITGDILAEAGDLSGKVVIDCTNDVSRGPGDRTMAADIARRATGANVVKAFNTVFASLLGDLDAVPDLLFCGDNDGAKSVVATLIRDAGFEPIDAGGLDAAAELEDFARVVIRLAYGRGMGQFAYRLRQPSDLAAQEPIEDGR